jgi:peptide/nickel transport system substrate-binding protein
MAAVDRPETGRRLIGRVTFRLARGTDDAIEDLLSGRSQLVSCNSGRLEDAAARLPGVSIERRTSLFVKYLAFDVSREAALFCPARTNPFRSAGVRRAVDLLIDRNRLAGTLAGTRAATQIVPPVVFGFDPELPALPHDPGEARRLLREEGFPDGVRVALHTRRIFSESAGLVKAMLAEGGIDVEVVILADAEYADAVRDRVPTLALDRFACETGDASEIFDELVHSNDPVRRLGEFNFGGWSDPALDREIETSDVAVGAIARNTMLRHVMDRVREEHLLIPLDVEEDAYAVRRDFAWKPREDGDIRAAEIAAAAQPPPR